MKQASENCYNTFSIMCFNISVKESLNIKAIFETKLYLIEEVLSQCIASR